jgi:hypothetical protein
MNQQTATNWLGTELTLASYLVHHTVCSTGAFPVTMATTTQVIHYN